MKKQNLKFLVLLLFIVACDRNNDSLPDPGIGRLKKVETITNTETQNVNLTGDEQNDAQTFDVSEQIQEQMGIIIKNCPDGLLSQLEFDKNSDAFELILDAFNISELSCEGSEFYVKEGTMNLPEASKFNYQDEVDQNLGVLLIDSLNTLQTDASLNFKFVFTQAPEFSKSEDILKNYLEIIDWSQNVDKKFNRSIFISEDLTLEVDLAGKNVTEQPLLDQFFKPVVEKISNLSKNYESLLALKLGVKNVVYDFSMTQNGLSTVCDLSVSSKIVSELEKFTDEADLSKEVIRLSDRDYAFDGGYVINCSSDESIDMSIEGFLNHYKIENSILNRLF
ncbi:MAG: hypothetical protein H6622_07315 [Halobacteriovoraceae bacterium]|nr:hypothetical protein [Halobacteriovoraceae bacterium]